MQELNLNSKYEVLTPSGWANFDGVNKKTVNQTIIIKFKDGSVLHCTEKHLIKIEGEFIAAEWVAVGQKIENKIVDNIEYSYEPIEVFDLVNVNRGNEYYTNDIVSHNCEFMGSAGTLISSYGLKSLAFVTPLHLSDNGIKIYEQPIKENNYVIVVDTSRGKGLDYSALVVINTTEIPYKLVATYKDNNISPLVYPAIIKKLGDYYNSAYVLVEINDNGQQVVDSLFDDYEYENILSTVDIKKKIAVTWGYGSKSQRGVRTTKSVKRLGCSILKNLIENQKMLIQDFDTIAELSTFISNNNSYEAEEGSHDDLVMCLVLFSWLTNQQFFSELSTTNIKEKLYNEQMRQIEEEALPMIMSSDENNSEYYSEGGVLWKVVER